MLPNDCQRTSDLTERQRVTILGHKRERSPSHVVGQARALKECQRWPEFGAAEQLKDPSLASWMGLVCITRLAWLAESSTGDRSEGAVMLFCTAVADLFQKDHLQVPGARLRSVRVLHGSILVYVPPRLATTDLLRREEAHPPPVPKSADSAANDGWPPRKQWGIPEGGGGAR